MLPDRLTASQRGVLVLMLMTMIWGTTFPTMKYLHGSLNALQIMFVRFVLAAAVMLPLWRGMRQLERREGLLLGVVMFTAFYLQIEGLAHTSSNRNAFLTGLNVLLVPVLGVLAGYAVVRWRLWLACCIAAAGMALLFYEEAPWNVGDTLTLASAFVYAVYVLLLGRRSGNGNGMLRPARLAAAQTAVVAAASALGLLLHGGTAVASSVVSVAEALRGVSLYGWVMLLYLAFVASALAVVLQAWGQQHVSAVQSAIVYGLEPVFAAVAAWVILGELLGGWAVVGAIMIVTALIISQLDDDGSGGEVSIARPPPEPDV